MLSTTVILGIVASTVAVCFIVACCLRKKCMISRSNSQSGWQSSRNTNRGSAPQNLPQNQEQLTTQPFDSVDQVHEDPVPGPQVSIMPICERNKNCNPSSSTCDDGNSTPHNNGSSRF